jgi:hypothetical protein
MAHPVSKVFESYRQCGGSQSSTGAGAAEAYIQANLSVRNFEKNKYGEVFTPYSYICDLLDQLPTRVWRDPGLRWLEPASGIGNFCLVIYMRLMDGLMDTYPDQVLRHEHILRNMIYMVEINEDNVARTRDLFGPLVNITCGDFLEADDLASVSVSADIVIGNPPFQTPRETARISSKGGQTLWDKFIVKSIGILRHKSHPPDSGTCAERFLCFITPPAWRKPNSPHGLWPMMTTKPCSLRYIHMMDKKTAIRDLCVQQRMDLFVVRIGDGGDGGDGDGDDTCRVITSASDGNTLNMISPRDWPFLPNTEFESIQGILDPKGPDPRRVLYDRSAYGSDLPHMAPEYRAGEFIYPVVHTMTRRGLGLWYSNTKTRGTGHFGKTKVILNFNEKLYPYLDYSGEYGMGQFSFGLPVGGGGGGGGSVAEGDGDGYVMVRALNSQRFQAIVRATKWGAYQTDRRMFEYFRDGWWRSPLFTTTLI